MNKQQKSVIHVVSSFIFEQTEFPIQLLHTETNLIETWKGNRKQTQKLMHSYQH
jgi:hypothetical protein